jgi:hypothetical protein
MAHPNEDLVRRGYEAFNTGDVETLRQLRKLSTFVRQVGHGFVESAASLIGLLIQAAVGSSGGVGGLRTNRSGWAA